jgi:CRP/FNR family transcriptional regulator
MTQSVVFDLAKLRRSCTQCSLQTLCLPAGIDQHDLAQLDAIVHRRRPLARGQRLFRIGAPMEALHVVHDGAFKTVALSDEGGEQIVGFHLAGELMGLDALGEGQHRCEAEALVPSIVCEVPLDALDEVCRAVPGLQTQLLRVIGRSIGRDQDHLAMLARRQSQERIAMFLHGLSERYRQLGRSPIEFNLPMSREDIARYLGLVIETVSRSFTRLQDDGLIKVRGRQLRILDLPALETLAHGPSDPAPTPVRSGVA